MNLKVPGAILPLGCVILSTRVKTAGWLVQLFLGELGLSTKDLCLSELVQIFLKWWQPCGRERGHN